MQSYRFLKAYRVTFQVLSRYLWVFLRTRWSRTEQKKRIYSKAHQKTAPLIVRNIIELKGLYIKIGQTLSIMTNFLPPEFREHLEQLQDAVPPHPYEEIEKRFRADFKKSPSEVFEKFETTPIASASLGQVHVAHLKDGTKLAIKMQYPDIDEIVKSDLETIRRIFGLLHWIFPHYGLKLVYEECRLMVLQELDFEKEADNVETIQRNLADNPIYVFPKVYREYSSKKILALEFMEGVKITNLDALIRNQIDPTQVANALIEAYCQQIFVDGLYHADPHPGNILVRVDQNSQFKISLLDFGATARIGPEMRAGITLFVEGLIKKDTNMLSKAMKQMGFVAKEESEDTFDKVVDYFYDKIQGIKIENFQKMNISEFHNLSDLVELKKMDISFKELMSTFHIPRDWILLERTLLLLMGLTAHLDPKLNPIDQVLPYVETFVLGKDRKLADLIVQTTKDVALSYINLPAEVQKILKKLEKGQLDLKVSGSREHARLIYAGIHQLIYTLFFILSVGFTYFHPNNTTFEDPAIFKYSAGFFGFLILTSFYRNRHE